ncbi:hypothetical protein GC177_01020 [bacterium]|nr:hypothetical protein [bacterium]
MGLLRDEMNARVRDHLDWFASRGAYDGKGCMEKLWRWVEDDPYAMDFLFHGVDEDGRQVWMPERWTHPEGIAVLLGGDTEMLANAPESGERRETYLRYVAEGQARHFVAGIPALLEMDRLTTQGNMASSMVDLQTLQYVNRHRRIPQDDQLAGMAQREEMSPCLAELACELEQVFLKGHGCFPPLEERIGDIEHIQLSSMEMDHDLRRLHAARMEPQREQLEPLADVIIQRLPQLAGNRDLLISQLVFAANLSAADHAMEACYRQLEEAHGQNPDAFNYLSPGVTHMAFPFREAMYGVAYGEARYHPAHGEASGNAWTEAGGQCYLTAESSMQQRIADFRRRFCGEIAKANGDVFWGRTHVGASLQRTDADDSLSLNIEGDFNPLTQWMAGVMTGISIRLGERNPESHGDVAWSPKRYDSLKQHIDAFTGIGSGCQPTHFEWRNVMTPDDFALLYPRLAAEGIDPYEFATMELLGGMRHSINRLVTRFATVEEFTHHNCARPYFELLFIGPDQAPEYAGGDASWQRALYGNGELASYVATRMRPAIMQPILDEIARHAPIELR